MARNQIIGAAFVLGAVMDAVIAFLVLPEGDIRWIMLGSAVAMSLLGVLFFVRGLGKSSH